jgi:ABC-2 type transport system ATP-binding protein
MPRLKPYWRETMDKVLEVLNVTKIYPNGKKANDRITLNVNKGEIVGIIGPNGAGKTTLLRQILGLLKPTEGTITLMGEDITKNPTIIKRESGYEPQYPLFFPSLTVEETIGFALKFKGYRAEKLSKKLSYLIDLLHLSDVRKYFGYQLSPGLIKLVLLAVSIAQSESMLVLDEPTSMIDIVNKDHIWNILSSLKKDKSILMASHDMNEVKKLCNRIYIIVNGKVVVNGSPEEISHLMRLPCRIRFATENEELTKDFLSYKQIELTLENSIFDVAISELGIAIDLIKEINDSIGISYIEFEAPSFDEAVMKLVGGAYE